MYDCVVCQGKGKKMVRGGSRSVVGDRLSSSEQKRTSNAQPSQRGISSVGEGWGGGGHDRKSSTIIAFAIANLLHSLSRLKVVYIPVAQRIFRDLVL